MGFQIGPGARERSTAGVPWLWILLAGIVIGGGIVGILAGKGILGSHRREATVELEVDPRPVIVSLQQLGELHTVKLTMKEVLRKSSEKDAEGWMHQIPGADDFSRHRNAQMMWLPIG